MHPDAAAPGFFRLVGERRLRPTLLGAMLGLVLALSVGGQTEAVAAASPSSLVNTIETWRWSPPSPDPSGLAYDPVANRLLVVDGEVDEMSIYEGANYYEATLGGSLLRTTNTLSFSPEPVGVAFDPAGRGFVSDDDQNRVFQVTLGADGRLDPSDPVTSFSTSSFGSGDPEGVAYDSQNNRLFIADGVGAEIYELLAVDGVFGNGDDQVRHFDTAVLGVDDPETVEFNPGTGTLYTVGVGGDKLAEVTTSGALVSEVDISYLPLYRPAGLAHAPRSTDPASKSFYIADRKLDNDGHPTENDGAIYEVAPGESGASPPPPISLSARGYKVKGRQRVDLTWSGATSAEVDIRRNGLPLATTANDTSYTDNIDQKGSGTYRYVLCEAGSSTKCSAEVTVTF